MNILHDIPILSLAQFSALHMAISVQGFEYTLSSGLEAANTATAGWCPIARLFIHEPRSRYAPDTHLFLEKPKEIEDES